MSPESVRGYECQRIFSPPRPRPRRPPHFPPCVRLPTRPSSTHSRPPPRPCGGPSFPVPSVQLADYFCCTSSRPPSSASQDHPSPLTPDSYFYPAPAIVGPDEFALQIDAQLDKMVGLPHRSSITHLLPQPSVPSPKSDPCFLSGDDMSKVQVLLRNRGRWENMYNRFESSPPLRPHDAPRVPRLSQDSPNDGFSWEAAHPAPADSNQSPDPSRYSLLIHEVSLLVGLTADDDHLSPDNGCPLVPDASKQPDILPFGLTPTKSLASRKHRNANLSHPTNTNVTLHSSNIPISPSINPHALHNEKPPPVGSRDLVTRHQKRGSAARPSLSPRRRHGQVFHFEPPLGNASHRNAVVLDETFFHPREPPPKPTPNPPANRCSSLDRLECSLRKLEAHAPSNHRKSQSEVVPQHVTQRKDKRPSLPPPRHLKKQQSRDEIIYRNVSRPAHDCRLSGPPPPVPRPTPPHQSVVPQVCTAIPSDDRDDHHEEDLTPGSFMDMDIPHTEEVWQKRPTSFRRVAGREKMKSLVSVAKRVSRGVIAWGKNLTGSSKPPVTGQETTTVQSVSF